MIRVNDVHIHYQQGEQTIHALRGVSLDINEGDYIAFIGPSGSGKSSLIAAIAGLVFPTAGDIFVDRYRINKISRGKRASLRATYFSVIFQFSEMIGRFTIRENLLMSWQACHGDQITSHFQERLEYLTAKLDIFNLLDAFPGQLSGGQLQKTAIARALIRDLPIILADEPSGDLDPETFVKVKNLFREEHDNGKGIFLVTHDMKLAFDAKTIFELRDGLISSIVKS